MLLGIGFVFGTFIGSFLNVCIWRMPREQSIVRPRSRCPHCAHPIAWYDNLPVLSFVLLRARCRHCHQAISWRYPLVEVLSGLAAVAALGRFGLEPKSLVYLGFLWALLAASFIDLDFQIIPDEISLGGLALGVAISPLVPQLHGTDRVFAALTRSVIGALVGGGLLYLTGLCGNMGLLFLRRLGVRLRRHPFWRAKLSRYRHVRESLGGGDVKLLAMAGSILGWKAVALTFFLSPLLAILPGIWVLVTKRSHVIPYGPFLSLGLIVSLFAGEPILRVSGIEETMRFLWWYYSGNR